MRSLGQKDTRKRHPLHMNVQVWIVRETSTIVNTIASRICFKYAKSIIQHLISARLHQINRYVSLFVKFSQT